jgi:hypothetical protein
MFIPEPDLDFLPIPDPGVNKAPDHGSVSATLVASFVIFRNRIQKRQNFHHIRFGK